jgi:hypothetical protein
VTGRPPVPSGRLAAQLDFLLEVDAGDTFVYDEAGQVTRPERERLAADRLSPVRLNHAGQGRSWLVDATSVARGWLGSEEER